MTGASSSFDSNRTIVEEGLRASILAELRASSSANLSMQAQALLQQSSAFSPSGGLALSSSSPLSRLTQELERLKQQLAQEQILQQLRQQTSLSSNDIETLLLRRLQLSNLLSARQQPTSSALPGMDSIASQLAFCAGNGGAETRLSGSTAAGTLSATAAGYSKPTNVSATTLLKRDETPLDDLRSTEEKTTTDSDDDRKLNKASGEGNDDEERGIDSQGNELFSETFPFKVYRMLNKVEQEGNESIVSFNPDGSSFKIHKPNDFATKIMPEFFTTSRMSSFQRQLNLYGFRRINEGKDKGSYCHEFFKRGQMSLCRKIKRKKVPLRDTQEPWLREQSTDAIEQLSNLRINNQDASTSIRQILAGQNSQHLQLHHQQQQNQQTPSALRQFLKNRIEQD